MLLGHIMLFAFYGIFALLNGLMQMTTDLYLPAMPQIASYFFAPSSTTQLTFTYFMVGMGFSHLLFAPPSDRFGRKKPLVLGLCISVIGSSVCFSAVSIQGLLLGRFLQGLGIGCMNSLGRSLIRDKFHGQRLAKIGSIFGMFSVVLMIASPILGGMIAQYYGWKMCFILLAVYGLVVVILTILFFPETSFNKNPKATQFSYIGRQVYQLIRHRTFISYTLCSCFAAGGLIAWFTVGAFILTDDYALTPVEIGLQNIYLASAAFLSGLINLCLINTLGIRHMVKIGSGLMTLSGALLIGFIYFSDELSLRALMALISLFTTGAGLVFINAFAGAFEPVAAIAGIAGMIYALMQDGIASISSRVIAIEGLNNRLGLACLLLLLGILSMISIDQDKQQAEQTPIKV